MSQTPHVLRPDGSPRFRFYPLVMGGFITVLLCSNLIAPGKLCTIPLGWNIVPDWNWDKGWFWSSVLVFGAGNLFFPISYIFDDVLTEVYGYAQARKVIWAGFGAMLFATIMSQVIIRLPWDASDAYSTNVQQGVETIFSPGPRIIVGSIIAFWAGDFVNSYVLAKMKILTHGRWLWTRTIGSTIVGEALDSVIFYPIALMSWVPMLTWAGVTSPGVLKIMDGWPTHLAVKAIIFNWVFKVMVEVLLTPLTYFVCNWLKRAESVDHFDRDTDFNPFSLKD